MSNEQWGHGYWKGVQDANAGTVNRKFQDEVHLLVCDMCIENETKTYDKTLYPVIQLIARLNDEKYVKRVYDYILAINSPVCFISGPAYGPWENDCFVLPYSPRRAKAIKAEILERGAADA